MLLRSLRFYWRTHLTVLLGVAVTGALLTGALVVGDSVRFTLRQMALARLGRTEWALSTPDHFFRARLADELAGDLQAPVAPLLLLRGAAALPDGRARANDVQVAGVEDRFWQLGGTADPLATAAADEAAVSERLAQQLGLHSGDSLVVRVEPPALVSRDAPLSGRSDVSVAFRVQVRAVLGDRAFGRFSLQAGQVPPLTVFLPLPALQAQLKRAGLANVLLAGAAPGADAALRRCWTLADAGLDVRAVPGQGTLELRTERVFLDPLVAAVALNLASNAAGVLTYFVNEIRLGDRVTPYSFVTATSAPGRSAETPRDDAITINSWLAEDLGAKIGDELTLRYFVIGARRQLTEQTDRLRVAAITPLQADASWMPAYPGLADVDHCREWEPGLPLDMSRIRPKDEEYWNKNRGTPKAFVALATGQRLWSNRFGNLTAIRYPADKREPAVLAQALKEKLDPAALGLFFVPVREQALQAGQSSQDFGRLFIGFSFFLIAAALLLTAMLFAFHVEQRQAETGLLHALGFAPAQVRWLVLREGWLLAALGTLLGLFAGAAYTKITLYALSTVWRGAVGATVFRYHAEPATLALGAGLNLLAAGAALLLVQRSQSRRALAELLACGAEMELYATRDREVPPTGLTRFNAWGLWLRHNAGWNIGGLGVLGAAALLLTSGGGRNPQAAEYFFGAGACLLIAGLGFSRELLAALARATALADNLGAVGRRNAGRRRGRSLTLVSVLAAGVFLLVAVSAFHQDPRQGAVDRRSGTGGFALYAQSALPVYDDLNSAAGQGVFGLAADALRDVTVLPLRVRDGDAASCLSLNRARQPRLLGVPAEELERRRAFTFAQALETGRPARPPAGRFAARAGHGWLLLQQPQPGGAVPAIGDEQTIAWALGKKLGDTLPYTDERGQTFMLRIVGVLAGSILQGNLLIAEQDFTARFPSTAGYREFLVDAPAQRSVDVAETLSQVLQDRGLEIVPAWRRLAEFMAVENTYLGIFQALGGLGLLLGSLGLGVVVWRNVLERRWELALLLAVGFRRTDLQRLVLSEHGLLILLGLAIGLTAALLAILPALQAPGTDLPLGRLGLTLAGLAAGGLLWSRLAARAALRGPLLPALRNE